LKDYEWKQHQRAIRAAKMAAMWDGHDYSTRVIPSDKLYKRQVKYRPRNAYDWEELED
jgi:hypothetical protein